MTAQINSKLLITILSFGVFGILNTEMGVIGIVLEVSRYYSVSIVEASSLVSGFALVVAFAAPIMPLIFSKVNRKTVMLITLGIFTFCNTAAVFAPTFEVLLALRVIPAAFHPLYTSMALALASSLKTPDEATQASSKVFVGVSAGMVLGAPVSSALATTISLQASLAFFALVTFLVFLATVFFIPSMKVSQPLSYNKQLLTLKKPLLWASLIAVVILNGAMFGFFGFLADYLEAGLGLDTIWASLMLLLYGGAHIVGNLTAGHLLAKLPSRTCIITPLLLFVLFAGLCIATSSAFASCVLLTIIGIIAGIANNINQFMVSSSAPETPDFTNGLYLTAANAGVAICTPLLGTFINLGGACNSIEGMLILLTSASILIIARTFVAKNRSE